MSFKSIPNSFTISDSVREELLGKQKTTAATAASGMKVSLEDKEKELQDQTNNEAIYLPMSSDFTQDISEDKRKSLVLLIYASTLFLATLEPCFDRFLMFLRQQDACNGGCYSTPTLPFQNAKNHHSCFLYSYYYHYYYSYYYAYYWQSREIREIR